MTYTLTFISIILFGATFVVLALTVVPLQIREARVVNGLAKLRRQLLIMGISTMTASMLASLILVIALLVPDLRGMVRYLVVLLSVSLFINALAKYRVYHEQYTPQHKALSRKIQQELEEGGSS